MESESPSIDPRYRPEFQRGYSAMAEPVARAPRADEPVQVGLPPVTLHDAESAGGTDARSRDSYSVKPPRNPYVFVIPVVAFVFVIFGTWLLVSQFVWSYSGAFGSDNSVERRFSGVLSYVFAAPLVTVGLGALVGYGFWLAVRRNP